MNLYDDYCTNYSFFSAGMNKKNPSENACFGDLFCEIKLEGNIKKDSYIIIKINDDWNLKDDVNNHLIVSQEEMYQYLELLKEIIDFEYTIGYDYEDSKYIIELHHNGYNYEKKHLCILVRFLYERPMNFALKDALTIYNKNLNKGINIIALTHLCTIYFPDFRKIHYITDRMVLLRFSIANMKEMFKKHFYIIDDIFSTFPEIKVNEYSPCFDDCKMFCDVNNKTYENEEEYDNLDEVYFNSSESAFNERFKEYSKLIDAYTYKNKQNEEN